MRILLTILAMLTALLGASGAIAEPRTYALEPESSSVSFGYAMMGQTNTGTMPIDAADLTIDFQRIGNSTATVTLNADGTQTGLIFATDALKGESVLNTKTYPQIVFQSTRFTAQGSGAQVQGNLTLRGVTKPLALNAEIYRQAGSETGDLSRLTVLLTGQLNRSDFGATGYADTVADTVTLRILVRLRRLE